MLNLNIDDRLDKINEFYDLLFTNSKFNEANKTLENIVINDINIDVLVCVLTCTLLCKNLLPYRETFVKESVNELLSRFSKEEVKDIMMGLN